MWRVLDGIAEGVVGGWCYRFFVKSRQKEFDGGSALARVEVVNEGIQAAIIFGFGVEVVLVNHNAVEDGEACRCAPRADNKTSLLRDINLALGLTAPKSA